jgi:hypothetical protein
MQPPFTQPVGDERSGQQAGNAALRRRAPVNHALDLLVGPGRGRRVARYITRPRSFLILQLF